MQSERQRDTGTCAADEHHYCCVECLTPTPSLYRRYTTHASVKLTRCRKCSLDVDPYVEREAMLIAFDVILHRLPAYRHTLFNRDPFADFCPASSIGRSFKFGLGLSILDAYIKYEALRFLLYSGVDAVTKVGSGGGDDDPSVFAHLLAWSFLEQMLLLIGTILFAMPLLNKFDVTSSSVGADLPIPTRAYIVSRLALAIMLPSTFKAVTIFVHIWENSPTTRILGSLFVASMQWMGVHCCMERVMTWIADTCSRQQCAGEERKGRLEFIPGYPLIGGFMLRSIVPIIFGFLLDVPIMMRQCSGIRVVVPLVPFGDREEEQAICFL